jgi:glycosyltransferase involved in cell wall biosynthesis
VATLWSTPQDLESAKRLQAMCTVYALPMATWRSILDTLLAVPTGMPLQANFSWQPGLAETIARSLDGTNGGPKYDIVHVEHLRGVKYGLHLQSGWSRRGRPGFHLPPIVWDSVDSISLLFRQSSTQSKRRAFRWLTRFELKRTERYEAWLPGKFPQTLVTSPVDRQHLISLTPSGHAQPAITVIPNGVDLDYFTPDPKAGREPATLVVSGKMSYHANVSMVLYLVQDIMPKVWERLPQTKLWIVGKDPSREIMALAGNPNITVTGTVEDIRPYLQKATLCVAPLTYGAGIQNKVLEGMACGAPVVATPQAVSALGTLQDRDVLVASDPGEFADKIVTLVESINLQKAVGESGRRYVEIHHDWGGITAKLEGVYHDTIQAYS